MRRDRPAAEPIVDSATAQVSKRRLAMSKKREKPSKISRLSEKRASGRRSPPVLRRQIIPNLEHIARALHPLAVRCSSLNLDPDNARLHPEENIHSIMKSFATFGQDQPLVVQKQGMVVR